MHSACVFCRNKLHLACIVYLYFCPEDYVYIYILRKCFLNKKTIPPPSFHSFSKALTPGCQSFFFIKVPGCLLFVGCADVEYNGTCGLCDYMATHTRSITDTHWMTDETPAWERSFTHNPSLWAEGLTALPWVSISAGGKRPECCVVVPESTRVCLRVPLRSVMLSRCVIVNMEQWGNDKLG